jgi:hypothetical protein
MNRALECVVRTQQVALCLVQKWWRPVTCIGIAGSVITNGVYIPLHKGEAVDMTGLAALIVAATGAFAVREVGKKWGTVS